MAIFFSKIIILIMITSEPNKYFLIFLTIQVAPHFDLFNINSVQFKKTRSTICKIKLCRMQSFRKEMNKI